MKNEIILDGKLIRYELKRSSRSRSIRVSISVDGWITVSTYEDASISFIERFMLSKSTWILKHLTKIELNPKTILSKNGKKDYVLYKEKAMSLAIARLQHFNAHYKLVWKSVTIRNQKTRWGSCSKKGALSFSYKIALLPEKHRDYIIVHELCHLGEFNHSSKFWNLVAKAIPDYKLIRKEIKQIV